MAEFHVIIARKKIFPNWNVNKVENDSALKAVDRNLNEEDESKNLARWGGGAAPGRGSASPSSTSMIKMYVCKW